jgi:hypothetical protein
MAAVCLRVALYPNHIQLTEAGNQAVRNNDQRFLSGRYQQPGIHARQQILLVFDPGFDQETA